MCLRHAQLVTLWEALLAAGCMISIMAMESWHFPVFGALS